VETADVVAGRVTAMRHDYNLPADWAAMTDQERCKWLTRDRCLRQALRQETPTARRLKKAQARYSRRIKAREGRVDAEANR
jgi:hypothetical protein